MAAAGNGNQELVSLLLSRGANIDFINKRGFTALMRATFNGHQHVVQLLCDQGAVVTLVRGCSARCASP